MNLKLSPNSQAFIEDIVTVIFLIDSLLRKRNPLEIWICKTLWISVVETVHENFQQVDIYIILYL